MTRRVLLVFSMFVALSAASGAEVLQETPVVPAPSATAEPIFLGRDTCLLARFNAPRKLEFQRLKAEMVDGRSDYNVRLVYDFGVLPIYLDTVGEIASSGVLNVTTPEPQLTFRCGDEDGMIVASLVLSEQEQRLRARAAAAGPNASVKTTLSSALSAYAIGDFTGALRKASSVTARPAPPEDKASGLLLIANARAETGDIGGAKTALASVKRFTASRDELSDIAARADLRSFQLDTAAGAWDSAQRTVTSIDTNKLYAGWLQHQVTTTRDVAVAHVATSLQSGPLKDLLGDPIDNVRESAPPPFEPLFFVQWKRDPREFVDRLDPIFSNVYQTNLRPVPCPSDPPHRLCAVSRARQLGANHSGWLGRIVFRMVRWEKNTDAGTLVYSVRLEYAVTQRLAGQPGDPWQPCVGNTVAPGAAAAIETEAATAVDALRQVIIVLGRQGTS